MSCQFFLTAFFVSADVLEHFLLLFFSVRSSFLFESFNCFKIPYLIEKCKGSLLYFEQ